MKAVSAAEATGRGPRGARELAGGLEERLGMPARQYLRPSESTPRPAPWTGLAAASPEAKAGRG